MILYTNLELRGAKEFNSKDGSKKYKIFFEDEQGESVTYFFTQQQLLDKGITLKKGSKYAVSLEGSLNYLYLKEIKGA